jgi:hypothetical protein
MSRRVYVVAHNIAQFIDKLRIIGKLEGLTQCG